MTGVPGGQLAGPTILRQSRPQRDGLFGGLILLFAVALWRGYSGAATSGGRIAVVIFTIAFIIVFAAGWIRVIRRGLRLEISEQSITLIDKQVATHTLTRQSGDQLAIVQIGGGRWRRMGLAIPGGGTALPLSFFSLRDLRRDCTARGWRFTRGR